ncbi:MAG: hypothetical protein IJ180_09030 [Bacteroidales bacterium]|nr:hypothetical protein [Bacteroidales bacterium]
MWQLQNLYNSPANQMNLLRQAGLNPNMAYGSLGSATAGPLESAGSQTFSDSPVQVPNMSAMYQQQQQFEENMQLQKDIAKANIRKTNAEAESTENDNNTYQERFQMSMETAKLSLKSLEQDIQNKMVQHDLLNTDLSLRQLDLLFQQTTFGTRVNQIVENLKLTQDQRKLLKENIYLTSLKAAGQKYQNRITKAEAEFREKTNGLRIEATNSGYMLSNFMNQSNMVIQEEFMSFLGFDNHQDKDGKYLFYLEDDKNLVKYLNHRIGEKSYSFSDGLADATKLITLLMLMAPK